MIFAASVNRLEQGHDSERGDCAIISLGCLLGISYTEVLRAAAFADKDGGRDGLTVRSIKKIAKNYGVTLSLVKNSKTPVALSMNLMNRLTESDVKRLATDRNVPEALRLAARKKMSAHLR